MSGFSKQINDFFFLFKSTPAGEGLGQHWGRGGYIAKDCQAFRTGCLQNISSDPCFNPEVGPVIKNKANNYLLSLLFYK